ncbi:MAG: hypothetical protein ACPGVG_15750, partial [Mycobacterium sp.]
MTTTQAQVDQLRQTIRDLEQQAEALKSASEDAEVKTNARAIERIADVAKTLGVELDALIDDPTPPRPAELSKTLAVNLDLSGSAFTGFPVLVETPGVALRDVWSRPGPENVRAGKIAGDLQDAFRIYRADGVRLENVSASGAVDECIEIADSRGVTLYRALISDPIDEPGIHPKGTPHGHGLIVVGQRRQGVWGDWAPVVIQECLFANCGGR